MVGIVKTETERGATIASKLFQAMVAQPLAAGDELWEGGTRVALRCLTEVPFTGHVGGHVRMPPRNVVPKPIQTPHPPVWVACTRRDTTQLAAKRGIGALSFAFFDPEEAKLWVNDYERRIAAAKT